MLAIQNNLSLCRRKNVLKFHFVDWDPFNYHSSFLVLSFLFRELQKLRSNTRIGYHIRTNSSILAGYRYGRAIRMPIFQRLGLCDVTLVSYCSGCLIHRHS